MKFIQWSLFPANKVWLTRQEKMGQGPTLNLLSDLFMPLLCTSLCSGYSGVPASRWTFIAERI